MVVIYRTALQLDFNLRKLRQLVSLPGGTDGTFRKSKICHDILSIRFFFSGVRHLAMFADT